jgi:hypothetical protein
MAWLVVRPILINARFSRAAGAADIDASSRLRHVTKDASTTVDADAKICPYALLDVILESAGLTTLF